MLETRHAEPQLQRVLEQAAMHDCACPAQISREIANQRRLFADQGRCASRTDTDHQVHARIAASGRIADAALEEVLTDVLRLEGWDLERLEMPADLQQHLRTGSESDR